MCLKTVVVTLSSSGGIIKIFLEWTETKADTMEQRNIGV